jgi:hypothetical protein
MADILIALAILAAAMVAAMVTGAFLLRRALVRANRITRGRRSAAPLTWLWSWRLPARLHRRLRRAAQVAELAVLPLAPDTRRRRAVPPAATTPLHEVAAELVNRAVAVDDWVVSAGRLHPSRARPALAQLVAEVSGVEASCYRLQRVSAEWRSSLDRATSLPPAFPDVHERLDAVEAALAELPSRF